MSQLNIILGAGFSIDAGLPLVKDFNRYFNRDITDKLRVHSSGEWFWCDHANDAENNNGQGNWDYIAYGFVLQEILKAYGQLSNYEDLYDFLVQKDNNWYQNQFDQARQECQQAKSLSDDHPLIPLFSQYQFDRVIEILNYLIIDLLKIKVSDGELISLYKKFIGFIMKYDKVRVFTLNHDTLLERLFRLNEIEYSNGFTENGTIIFGDDIEKNNDNPQKTFQDFFVEKIHLHKLHGSKGVYGYKEGNDQGVQILLDGKVSYFIPNSYKVKHFARRLDPNTGKVLQSFNLDPTPKFITGKQKMNLITNDSMYSTLFNRFNVAFSEESDLLLVGYSYCDAHINEVIQYSKTLQQIININPGQKYPFKNGLDIKHFNSLHEMDA